MATLETQSNLVKNKIIQGTILFKDNWSYFQSRIEDVLTKRYTFFSPHKIDSAFIKVCIEFEDRPKEVLNRVSDYILNGTKNIQNDVDTSNDLRELICDLLDESVESENADAVRKILEWYSDTISTMTKLQGLVKEWNNEYPSQFAKKSSKNKALKINNSAMIRACVKNNFDMVLSFLNHNWVIDDHYYKPCKQDDFNKYGKDEGRFLPSESTSLFPMFRGEKSYDNLEDTLENFRLFHATSTIAFLLAKFRNKIDSEVDMEHDHNTKGSCQLNLCIKNEDPLSEAFHNAHIAILRKQKIIEYRKKFQEVEVKSKKFLVDMLDLCKNSEEAILLLSKDLKLTHYFGSDMHAMTVLDLPRLDLAVMNHHLEFVAHDYCQHVLRTKWLQSSVTKQIIRWGNSNIVDIILYICKCVLLTPIYLIFFLPYCISEHHVCLPTTNQPPQLQSNNADEIELEDQVPPRITSTQGFGSPVSITSYRSMTINKSLPMRLVNSLCYHYSFPVNRFIAAMLFYVIYVCFMVINVFNFGDVNPLDDTGWYNITMISVTVCYIVDDIRRLKSYFRRKGWRKFSANHYDLIVHILVVVGCLAKIFGFVFNCPEYNSDSSFLEIWKPCNDTTIASLPPNSPVKIGYTVSGIAVTMAILKFLYWFQINSWIGPLVITIKRVTKDIILVMMAYGIFLVAFSTGIYHILQLSLDLCKGEAEKYGLNQTSATAETWNKIFESSEYPFDIEEPENKFILLRSGFKVAFWSIFDPGHPEVVGCSQGSPRYIGMVLWAVFQLLSSTILINLLIAMMNTTIMEIQKDKMTEWKFARTEIWIQFFDKDHILPPPINMIEMVIRSIKGLISKPKQTVDFTDGLESSCGYSSLVNELSERYLHNEEDSAENDVTKEDLVNTKRELLRSMNLFAQALNPSNQDSASPQRIGPRR